jgi:two-component system OmpR family response regulator
MTGTSTIVVALEDLSIAGTEQNGACAPDDELAIENRFFELLRKNRPDVIVLDLCDTNGRGIKTIRKIRERSGIPILVICAPDDIHATDYRLAGAAERVFTPVDIVVLNETIQRIIRLTAPVDTVPAWRQDAVVFAGMTFRPDRNALRGPDGKNIRLTTAENNLLTHLLARSRTLCSRAELVDMLYGRHRPTSDRAIDTVVNRLRKKLVSVGGPTAEHVVKTEFRRGYVFVADVSSVPPIGPPPAEIRAAD